MSRVLDPANDALFVEGPDDGVVINALIKKALGIELAKRPYLVRANEEGGGDSWALRKFDEQLDRMKDGARLGLVVDRDTTENDKWPAVRERLRRLGGDVNMPSPAGAILGGRVGIWMWPDNVSHGDLETFLVGIIPESPMLTYASEASTIAKDAHGAEYEPRHARKAALKVRSIWRDASAAGGYGHLVRNLELIETSASAAFLAWFNQLFLE